MRRGDREITDRKAIDGVLRRAQVCHLGLHDGTEPYVVPVSFGLGPDCLYVHSACEGRKIDILREHPRVCFEVVAEARIVASERPCAWACDYQSVIGWGTAHLVDGDAEKAAALNAIMEHYGGEPSEFSSAELARVLVIRIDIERMTAKGSHEG